MFGPSLGLNFHRLAIGVGKKIYVYNIRIENEEFDQAAQSNDNLEFKKELCMVLDNAESQVCFFFLNNLFYYIIYTFLVSNNTSCENFMEYFRRFNYCNSYGWHCTNLEM